MDQFLAEAFRAGVTFCPADGQPWFDRLLDAVGAQRQATLMGLSLRPPANNHSSAEVQQFREAVHGFAGRPSLERDVVVHDPIFMIWLMNAVRAASTATTGQPMSGLGEFEAQVTSALDSAASPGLSVGSAIPLRRFDVNPLLAQVAPPTYEFPTPNRATKLDSETAYSLPFFQQVASIALAQIGQRWSDLGLLIPRFVRLLVHVPSGQFRSASAARYTGVVFLTADDETMLDVEESIVHEYGHQVLYRIMELDPLVADQAGEFSLPWSGATRDFYGYFHAFCIYILLADYFSRVIGATQGDERNRAIGRREAVLEGIQRALRDFPNDRSTLLGVRFLELMRERAAEVSRGVQVEVGA